MLGSRAFGRTDSWCAILPDPRALDWLRSKGEGRVTRINEFLINLMDADSRTEPGNEMMLVVLILCDLFNALDMSE
ncbi:MAG: hypothetical protein ABSC88_00825 [Terracidiphilus sp.]